MAAVWIHGLGPMHIANSIGAAGYRSIHWPTATGRRLGTVGRDWPIRQALRVLVVDNQRNTADAVVWLVRCWGHTGYSASSSAAALKISAACNPDVVLLDMEMPLMDGYQLAQQLRHNILRNDCFIVASTKQGDDSLRRECTRSGIDLVLNKPVDPALLEILLLLEGDLVNRSRTEKGHATKIQNKGSAPDEPDNPRHPRGTGGSPC